MSLHLLGLEAGDLRGPLAIYNARAVDEQGAPKLFADVNKALGRKAVADRLVVGRSEPGTSPGQRGQDSVVEKVHVRARDQHC